MKTLLLAITLLSAYWSPRSAAAADSAPAITLDIANELVRRAFRGLLFREPSGATLAAYAPRLVSGGPAAWRRYLRMLANTVDFKTRVRPRHTDEEILAQIYEHLLGPNRPVDPSGRRSFLPLVTSGQVARVAEIVGTSPEFIEVMNRRKAPPRVTEPRHAPNSAGHLQYFGYYRDGGRLGDIADHANLTIGDPGSDESGNPSIPILQEAKRRGMKVMLSLQGIGIGFREEDSWREKWAKYVANVGPYIDRDTVAAFYLYDEPPLEMTPEWRRKLEIGAEVVRETFPGIPIALGFGWWSLSPDLQNEWPLTPPAGYDWFAFNCYGPVEQCIPNRPTPLLELFNILKRTLNPGQRIVLIPPGSDFHTNDNKQPFSEEDLITRADQYLELAQSEPVVIAVVPFIWSGRPAGVTRTVSELPALREKFREIGRAITGRR